MDAFKKLFMEDLAVRYDVEKRLIAALPATAKSPASMIAAGEKASNQALVALSRARIKSAPPGNGSSPHWGDERRMGKTLNIRRGLRPLGYARTESNPM